MLLNWTVVELTVGCLLCYSSKLKGQRNIGVPFGSVRFSFSSVECGRINCDIVNNTLALKKQFSYCFSHLYVGDGCRRCSRRVVFDAVIIGGDRQRHHRCRDLVAMESSGDRAVKTAEVVAATALPMLLFGIIAVCFSINFLLGDNGTMPPMPLTNTLLPFSEWKTVNFFSFFQHFQFSVWSYSTSDIYDFDRVAFFPSMISSFRWLWYTNGSNNTFHNFPCSTPLAYDQTPWRRRQHRWQRSWWWWCTLYGTAVVVCVSVLFYARTVDRVFMLRIPKNTNDRTTEPTEWHTR